MTVVILAGFLGVFSITQIFHAWSQVSIDKATMADVFELLVALASYFLCRDVIIFGFKAMLKLGKR